MCAAHLGDVQEERDLEERQCSGQTKKKARCKTKGRSARDVWYCDNHIIQAGNQPEQGDTVPDIDDRSSNLDKPIVISAELEMRLWPSVNHYLHDCSYNGSEKCKSQIYCGPGAPWYCVMHRELAVPETPPVKAAETVAILTQTSAKSVIQAKAKDSKIGQNVFSL